MPKVLFIKESWNKKMNENQMHFMSRFIYLFSTGWTLFWEVTFSCACVYKFDSQKNSDF